MMTKILLVDDESAFVEALARRLDKRGLKVSIALNGSEALEKLAEDSHIDVAVVDVKMPGMDGIEVLQKLRAKYPLIEVIMLTGHATVESAIEGMKLGALDYLMKPCDVETLMEKIKSAKNKKAAQEDKIAQARAFNIALRRGD